MGAAPVFVFVLNTSMFLFSALAANIMHMSPKSVSYTLSFFMFVQSSSVVFSGMHGSFFSSASFWALSGLLCFSCLGVSLFLLFIHCLCIMLYISASQRQFPSILLIWPGFKFSPWRVAFDISR